MLSPVETAALDRGQVLKRIVKSAAALNELYDDTAIGDAVGLGRGAVGAWWRGAKPGAETVPRLAVATGLSADELYRFLYADGPPPRLPASGPAGLQEGVRLGQERPDDEAPDTPPPSPPQLPRDG